MKSFVECIELIKQLDKKSLIYMCLKLSFVGLLCYCYKSDSNSGLVN